MQAAMKLTLLCAAFSNAFAFVPTTGTLRFRELAKQKTLEMADLHSAMPRTTPNPWIQQGSKFASKSSTPLHASVEKIPVATSAMEDYVQARGGNYPIKRVLIANNGMAATKAILSMRQWAYTVLGDEKAIEFVAMATPEDLNANAEFIRLADRFVEVPAGSNKNNYANVELIVDIAVKEGVDAVWPGWGHASENPKLPGTLKARGIKFIGPPAPVMAVLGDKIAANILAQTAKVPSIPWSGDGLTAELTAEGTIPDEIFNKAMVTTVDEAVAAAARIGYPVMLKASEGGGGKGIRMSDNEEALRTNFVQVENEVPGSPMFMMQLCTSARHLEIQVVGDEHGNAIALNGRDCSTQRRFQKIFEEGPPTIAKPDTFKKMEESARRLVQSIGYIGAGTVEYLYNAETDKYFFLELNPRLQVEHPVTEGITGANVPATQLQVAMGIPLYNIPSIRAFYGEDPLTTGKIDFDTTDYRPIDSHVIAARITAENPDEGFKPTSGSIDLVKFQSTPDVWGYFSVGANGGIHEYADSQFGHLFAKGPTREEARKSLVLALKRLEVRGEIRTTVEYLVQLLETKEFKENTIDTSWLDGLIREKTVAVNVDPQVAVTAAVIFRAFSHCKQEQRAIVDGFEKGQTALGRLSNLVEFPIEITYGDYKYQFLVQRGDKDEFKLLINGQSIDAKVREQPDGSLLATFGGLTRKLFCMDEPLGLRMILDGTTVLIPTVFDPSELRTDVTGKIVRYLQEDGGSVNSGEAFVEVEAMKMIMPLKATEAGQVTHVLSPGSIISAGDLLANLKLKDPSKAKKILPFTEQLDVTRTVQGAPASSASASAAASDSDSDETDTDTESITEDKTFDRLRAILSGYDEEVEENVQKLMAETTSESEIVNKLVQLFEEYYRVESTFQLTEGDGAVDMDSVILSLVKENKDDLTKVVDLALAHTQEKRRSRLILNLLRQAFTFGDRYGGLSTTEPLVEALNKLRSLNGDRYGEILLTTEAILRELQVPPFEERSAELRQALKSSDDMVKMSQSSSLSAGVDLLSSLFNDEDKEVRARALEVYIRRVYRAHRVLKLDVSESENGMPLVTWEFQFRDTPPEESPIRRGVFMVPTDFSSIDVEAIRTGIEKFKSAFPDVDAKAGDTPLNVFHIAFAQAPTVNRGDEHTVAPLLSEILFNEQAALRSIGIRYVNALLPQNPQIPRYFTFAECNDFGEDLLRRDMRPTFPQLLELSRLATNFDLERLPAIGRNAQLYLGVEKNAAGARAKPQTLFLRAISHSNDLLSEAGAERMIVQGMDELEHGLLNTKVNKPTVSSRLYVSILGGVNQDPKQVVKSFRELMAYILPKYAKRLIKLRVDEIEIKVRTISSDGSLDDEDSSVQVQPVRLMASSMAGSWLRTDAWLEYPDPITGVSKQFCSLTGETADRDICVMSPYPASNMVQVRRSAARRVGSTYVYDFLGLMEIGLLQEWETHFDALRDGARKTGIRAPSSLTIPERVFEAKELVLEPPGPGGEPGKLVPSFRLVGTNDIGMVAWVCTMKTPEYPQGREVVLIANDVTYQSGSFGVQEDTFFAAASQYARERGLPRVYIACNSGARIGLVEELKPLFQVAWRDENNPAMGFDYLYLKEDDYAKLAPGTVNALKQELPTGETRYVLEDIIGQVHGIGVENLRGSGMIAGETSAAYDDTFTLSYVTGRSVGIGAYLVRLGQRVIQMRNGPIILTGYSALNKLLGREVYTSQDQLGGPQIMHPNGVSHRIVSDDQAGVSAILNWLRFVPKTKTDRHQVPALNMVSDPVDRKVGFTPTKAPYDPRHMLAGTHAPDGSYVSGFFDEGSFTEYLSGWGKSVVVGRGRLGGIPFGAIAVETRLVEQRIPADPANPDSRETVQPQAGTVWYPDSAYKTAQAIEDFNRGENLPLIIFANWRGFSGGTRDMYGEILKFGSMIVDALRNYKHPVFVYIPPNGELRGGSWVVIDPTINLNQMEMYADKQSRGGILEPPGICEVKFRGKDQLAAMHRIDPVLKSLDSELESVNAGVGGGEGGSAVDDIKAQIKSRENLLAPLFLQVAHEFADLHDRSGRMMAKGVIRDVIDWGRSREYFYWRAKRRLHEDALRDTLVHTDKASGTIGVTGQVGAGADQALVAEVTAAIQEIIPEGIRASDKEVSEWFDSAAGESARDGLLGEWKARVIAKRMAGMLEGLSEDEKKDVIKLAGL